MEDLIENLGKWLKINKPEEQMNSPSDTTKRDKHWFCKGERRTPVSKPSRQEPNCMCCKESHWGDACPTYGNLEKEVNFS